MSNTNQGLFS